MTTTISFLSHHAEQPTPTDSLWLQFALITAIGLLITFTGQYLLISDELYFNAFAEQITYERIQPLVAKIHEWAWLSYLLLPVLNLLKFITVATCLSIGYFSITDHWTFKPFFRIAIQAELVLLLPAVVKLLWFLFVQTDYNLSDLQTFYPLSILSLLGADSVSSYLLYPLQLTNLFELAYWLVLAYGVAQVIEVPMPKAFGLVAASYGSGLLVWVALIMFLTVSLS